MRALLVQVVLMSLVMAVEPQARITNKLLFLVDVSGSMHGEKTARAIEKVIEIAGQETDDLEIACITFSDQTNRWPTTIGLRGGGWMPLPNADALVELRTWIDANRQTGNTPILRGLGRAMIEDKRDLTIVIVSDGYFDEDTDEILQQFDRLQKHREDFGLDRVTLVGVGISPSSIPENDELKALVTHAGANGGGYFVDEVAEVIGPH